MLYGEREQAMIDQVEQYIADENYSQAIELLIWLKRVYFIITTTTDYFWGKILVFKFKTKVAELFTD